MYKHPIGTNNIKPDYMIRLPEVCRRTGRSRSSIYADIKDKAFPEPISLGARSVGWLESEIDAWIEARITASRGGK